MKPFNRSRVPRVPQVRALLLGANLGITVSRLPLYAFVVFVALMYAAPAEAHLNTTGMGPIYDGLMHFLMSPEDFVPVLALALLAGLRGAAYGRRALFVLPVAWLLGGLAGLSASAANPHPFIAAGWFLLLGGLLAADAKLSLRVTTALAALLGLYHGYLNGTGMGLFETAAVALLGLVFAVFVLVALAAALVVRLRAEWARIAVRVAGSWIAASGLLLLGWAVRTR
jgi:hydrogenase/urease accessory protein HupE